MVFDTLGGAGGVALRARPGRGPASRREVRTGAATGFTDEAARLVPLDGETATVDPAVHARARQIASRLAVPRPRRDAATRRGSGDVASVRYRGGSDEIDLDATLQVLAESPWLEAEDVIVRERVRARRSVVLAVDVSGSMRGERVRTAAATVGALAAELERDLFGVIAFWSDAAVLHRLGDPVRSLELLDTMLQLPAKGLTNVDFPLQLAAAQLAGRIERDARVVLLSDCVHNAGPDPRAAAARLPRLDVLLDASGEHDADLARDLAHAGRGRLRVIRTHHDVAPALGAVFID